jgi:catechol 2,3-dioxygenase-like lactoylglutathione lyase family enzyme
MKPTLFDHVALWVAQRDRLAEFCCTHLGMHRIAEEDTFTLVGSHARHGKLTLFDAEGPRERGALIHVALRVSDLESAVEALPAGSGPEVEAGEGLRIRLVEKATPVEYDLDHVALLASDPDRARDEYASLGFEPAEPAGGVPRVGIGDVYVELHAGDPGDPQRPLLNHLAALVDSVEPHIEEATQRGIVESTVDAANTSAVFVWGPDRVRIEYVEHKPTFSLT